VSIEEPSHLRIRSTRGHIWVALLFAVLAVAWSFPLVLHLRTHLAGQAVNDNALSLWNFWWMRMARASGADFFYTSYRFAPAGEDLTLYTHTALPAYVGATVLGRLPVVEALNVTVLLALALNGFFAYLLAWRIVRNRAAAIVAGIVFGSSPYLSAHLNGHFDLTGMWTIPLFALVFLRAIEGSLVWAFAAGVVLAGTAYVAYYYMVYEAALVAVVFAIRGWEWSVHRRVSRVRRRWPLVLVAAAIVIAVGAIVAVAVTGGFDVRLGPIRINSPDAFNPLQAFWILAAVAVWMRWPCSVDVRPRTNWPWRRAVLLATTMAAAFAIVAEPLIWRGIRVVTTGQYVTQQYFWRSAPAGVDLLTLVLGNPFHAGWGGAEQRLYRSLGIDLFESIGWLGIVPVVLLVYAIRKKWADAGVREWIVIASVFFVWALGSHVHVAGWNTGLITPAAVVRWIPFVSNARMPGRAMVVVYLALGMLSAVALDAWPRAGRVPLLLPVLAAVLVSVDFLSAPFPIASMTCPRIYESIRESAAAGSVAELPMSVGDGLRANALFDQRFLVCQTLVHERPVVSGVNSRLPPKIIAAYRSDPLLAAWLRLSGESPDRTGPAPLPPAGVAAERLRADGIAFIMLNRKTAPPELLDHTEHVLPLKMLARDDERTLYAVVR